MQPRSMQMFANPDAGIVSKRPRPLGSPPQAQSCTHSFFPVDAKIERSQKVRHQQTWNEHGNRQNVSNGCSGPEISLGSCVLGQATALFYADHAALVAAAGTATERLGLMRFSVGLIFLSMESLSSNSSPKADEALRESSVSSSWEFSAPTVLSFICVVKT